MKRKREDVDSGTDDGSDDSQPEPEMSSEDELQRRPRVNFLWPPVYIEYESTVQHMKRLTAVAVSHLLYIRNYFDDNDYFFEKYTLGCHQIQILSDRCDCELNYDCYVCQLKNIFVGIDNEKIEKLILTFPLGENTDTDETYVLNYDFENKLFNISLDKSNSDETSDELTIISEEIKVHDIGQSVGQVVQSLEFKCKNMERLSGLAMFEIVVYTWDHFPIKGFTIPVGTKRPDNDKVPDIP